MLRHISNKKPWDPKKPLEGVRYPPSIATRWSDDDLAAIGLEKVPPPEPDTTPPAPRQEGAFREFMALFTDDEQDAIYAAEEGGAQAGDFSLRKWLQRAQGGATLRLNHPDTLQGVASLVTAGLLTQERADTILAADFDNPPELPA